MAYSDPYTPRAKRSPKRPPKQRRLPDSMGKHGPRWKPSHNGAKDYWLPSNFHRPNVNA